MHQFFVGSDQIGENEIRITGGDVRHIRDALRLHPGDQISVSDGSSLIYRCEIAEVSKDSVLAKILWQQEMDTELPCAVSLFQGLPKSDKMEWIIQKAVELGAWEIVPMETKRSVVKLYGGRAETKIRRWSAVSESAAKQSGRTIVPQIRPVMTFAQAVRYASGFDRKFIPYERANGIGETRSAFAQIRAGESVAVFIGPEGGFDESEIALAREAGILPVTLGRRILRTETAGMTVLSILMFQLETERKVADSGEPVL